jgi:transcriptional regulator with XRE-family HTH domain
MCKLNQEEMAKILGVAKITIARIESGTLSLSEKLANKVQEQFDVSAAWLLANDDLAPILTERDTLWSSSHFEFIQGSRSRIVDQARDGSYTYLYREGSMAVRGSEEEFIRWKLTQFSADIHAMLDATRGQPRQGILIYRINKMLSELHEDFSPLQFTLESYKPLIDQLREDYARAVGEKSDVEQKALRSKN